MSEKTPNVTHDTQPDEVQETSAETYVVPDRDTLLEEFTAKRQQYTDELNQLEAKPGFKRVYEDNAEIAGVKDDIEAVDTEWKHYGGDAIDAAQAKIDALNFKSTADEHIYAKAELRDAKNAFYENFKKEFEESNTTEAADNTESNSNVDRTESTAESNANAIPEGQRLTDFLKAIREAQKDKSESLSVLLKGYKELLGQKSKDPEWVQRHYDIAATPLQNSEANDGISDSEKTSSSTNLDEGAQRRRAAFAETFNETRENIDRAEQAEAHRKAVAEVISEARDRADASTAGSRVDEASVKPSKEVVPVESQEEEKETKRKGRIRKLAGYATSAMGYFGDLKYTASLTRRARRIEKERKKNDLIDASERLVAEKPEDQQYAPLTRADLGTKNRLFGPETGDIRKARKEAKKRLALENLGYDIEKDGYPDTKTRTKGLRRSPKVLLKEFRKYSDTLKARKEAEKAASVESERETPETMPMPLAYSEVEEPVKVEDTRNRRQGPEDINSNAA